MVAMEFGEIFLPLFFDSIFGLSRNYVYSRLNGTDSSNGVELIWLRHLKKCPCNGWKWEKPYAGNPYLYTVISR